VFRAAREDKDVKQAQMAYFLARGSSAISNMESQRTDFAVADAILWARALDADPKFLKDTFERLLLSVRQFYERQHS
jgi:transcriptional regulator with XRE-family HTH domain